MADYEWTLILRVQGCHSWFRDSLTGRVAVCDDSGKYPHLTDDGVIWLREPCNITRRMGYDDGLPWVEVDIPGEMLDGSPTSIGGTNDKEAVALANAGLAKLHDVNIQHWD